MTNLLTIISDLAKYFAGVISVILAEYLRRVLFHSPKIKINSMVLIFGPSDPQNVLVFSAVNLNDIPVIFQSSPMLYVSYLKQEIWSDGYQTARPDTNKYPAKLLQHDCVNYSYHLFRCIQSFRKERQEAYNDSTPIDVSRLRFQLVFMDTTMKQWKSRKMKIPRYEVKNIEAKLKKPIYNPAKARPLKKTITKKASLEKERPVN